jgi:hypothetical protein
MTTTPEKIAAYAQVAELLCARVEQFVAAGNMRIKEAAHELKERDSVMIALALKIDSSFRALIVDARAHRVESMHHLKTMVEAYIYFHVVGKDKTDYAAERLLCRIFREKEKFYRLNAATHDPSGAARGIWKSRLDAERALGIEPLDDAGLEAHRHSPELGQWYDQVYRRACEPAHLADVLEFMPQFISEPDKFRIAVGEARSGPLQASIAIEQGLDVMFSIAAYMSDNELNHTLAVDDLAELVSTIRRQAVDKA